MNKERDSDTHVLTIDSAESLGTSNRFTRICVICVISVLFVHVRRATHSYTYFSPETVVGN
jgi:hypothetical protein